MPQDFICLVLKMTLKWKAEILRKCFNGLIGNYFSTIGSIFKFHLVIILSITIDEIIQVELFFKFVLEV